MTTNIESEIRARVDTFVTDLCAIIRVAALEAVQEALGAGLGSLSARTASPAERAAKVSVKTIKPAKAVKPVKEGGRVRRSPEELESLSGAFLAHVTANPRLRLEEIGVGMGIDTKDLKRPVQVLLEAGSIRTEGQRRGTRYFAAEAPKAKARKAKVKPKVTADAEEETAAA